MDKNKQLDPLIEGYLSYMLEVSPRATQALVRHTDPRLTAGVYTDEKILPLTAALQNVPAIPQSQPSSQSIVMPASQVDTDIDVTSFIASLTPRQRLDALQMLTRPAAG